MFPFRFLILLLLAIASTPAITLADDAQTISISVPQGEKLTIRLPAVFIRTLIAVMLAVVSERLLFGGASAAA